MNKVYNEATDNYTQQVECAQVQGVARSESIPISILNNSVEFIKAPDNIFVEKGETIPYTLTLKNKGDLIIDKIEIIDILPQGITLVPDSLKVNGTALSGDIQTGIILESKLLPGGQIGISFLGRVTEVPPTVYNNKATAKYYYQLGNTRRTSTITSNTVVARAVQGILAISKKANKLEVQNQEDIIYTFTIRNEGNVLTENMILRDVLPPQVSYIPNTFTVNGVTKPEVIDLVAGVPVGNLAPGATMNIEFVTKIIDDSVSSVANRGSIQYTFIKDPNKPPVNNNTDSNLAVVTVHKPNISITKSANATEVTMGDIVTYTLVVKNVGTVLASNVIVTDSIPLGMSFMPNSLTVNGVPNAGNLTAGVNIGVINIGGQSTVVFKVVVNSIPPNKFDNSASVSFNYIVNNTNFTGFSMSNRITITAKGGGKGCAQVLKATKSANKSQVQQGEMITYTISIKNTSTQAVANVALSDRLDAKLNLAPYSIAVNGVVVNGTLENLMIGTIEAGVTVIVTFKVIVVGGCAGNFINNYATIKCTNGYCTNGPCPTESLQTNEVSIVITHCENPCMPGLCTPGPCMPEPCPPYPPHQHRCRIERVITPIYLPNYMKCIEEITEISGVVKSVKPISNGYHSKILVIYIVKIEYTNECGGVYTYPQCEEVFIDVDNYNENASIEITSIESPCVVDRHYVEVIVNMKICNC